MECLFCKIIKKEITAKILFEDENVIAFLDINPNSFGHTLLVPKDHILDVVDFSKNNDLNRFYEYIDIIQSSLEKVLESSGFIHLTNCGSKQDIKHFHMHLTPAFEKNEELYYKHKESTYLDNFEKNYLDEIKNEIKKQILIRWF